MDWSQLSIGAIGAVGAWVLTAIRGWIDAWIQEWSKDKDEERKIRAERRTEQREKEQRQEDAAARVAHNENTLRSIQIHIAGATCIINAAQELQRLHQFFDEHPRYTRVRVNREFLEKWPKTLYAELAAQNQPEEKNMTVHDKAVMLSRLKNDTLALKLSE
jgi:hypothetical protein